MNTSTKWIAALTALPIILLLASCGGSGGGGGDSDNVAPPAIDDSIRFTEDKALQQNLNGVWIATRTEQYQSEGSELQHSFEGTTRETIFVIENNFNELMIQNCATVAEGIENGSKSLAFELEGRRFELQKDSNTHLTGTIKVIDPSASGSGSVTLIKVKAAPNNRYDLYGQLSLGTLTYSDNGAPDKTFNIQCYLDFSGTESYSSKAKTDSVENNYHVLSNFFEDRVSFGSELDENSPNYRYLIATIDSTMATFENDGGTDIVRFTISGKNGPHFTFEASYPAATDASSDSFSGNATLEF